MTNNNILAVLVAAAIVVSLVGIAAVNNSITSITGAATGITNVTIATTVTVSLTVNNVDFGVMQVNENNDTWDNSPPPFELQNDGNTIVNVSVYATDLWTQSGYGNPTPNYLAAANQSGGNAGAGSIFTYTQMPDTGNTTWYPIRMLPYASGSDNAYLDINVTVPPEETPGVKTSTVTFTGSQA